MFSYSQSESLPPAQSEGELINVVSGETQPALTQKGAKVVEQDVGQPPAENAASAVSPAGSHQSGVAETDEHAEGSQPAHSVTVRGICIPVSHNDQQ